MSKIENLEKELNEVKVTPDEISYAFRKLAKEAVAKGLHINYVRTTSNLPLPEKRPFSMRETLKRY